MAWRIDEHVVRGEIDNRTRGRVTGRIWFADLNEPVTIELKGNAWHDVAGRRLEFVNPEPKPGLPASFARSQRGTIGDITASRKVRVPEIPLDQIVKYYAAKKPFPWHWGNSLYFEWFSDRNGRVVIESASYQLTISSDPTWQMSADEEREQRIANGYALEAFMGRASEALEALQSHETDKNQPDIDNLENKLRPQTEEEAEKMQADSDRLADRIAARLEREGKNADYEKIVAEELERARRIDEMNAAANEALEEMANDTWKDRDDETHPLSERALELSVRVAKDIEAREWIPENASPEYPVMMLLNSVHLASAKLAGALDGADWPPSLDCCAGIIVRLKRASGYLADAKLAAEACRDEALVDGDWLREIETEMAVIADEANLLIANLRAHLENRS